MTQNSPSGATPEPGATPGNNQDPASGATPQGGEAGEALVRALRHEREARRALEKDKTELSERLTAVEGELSGFRRRDAVEKALGDAVKARRDAGEEVEINLEHATAFLTRLSDAELSDAARDLVNALPKSKQIPKTRVIAGQPPAEEPGKGNGNAKISEYQRRRLLYIAGGREAVEAARSQPPSITPSPFGRW